MHTAISKTDSKDLLHNIENSTQYFIRTYMGKNLNIYVCMYVCVYVCVCVCVCVTHLKLTPTLSINYFQYNFFSKNHNGNFLNEVLQKT